MKLSIIVPVYNVAPYLAQCLESIANQTYEDFECILVDDGSTDGSRKICEAYVHRDRRFKLLLQSNKGVNFARNLALEQARGEYIGFVDADDYIARDMFFKLMSAAFSTKADIVICSWWEFYQNDRTLVKLYNATGSLDKELAMEDLALDHIRSYLWNKLFKRHLLESPRVLLTAKVMGDYSWMHYIFHKAESFFYVNESLYFYRYRYESIVHDINVDKRIQSYNIAKARGDFYACYYPHMLTKANFTLFRYAWNLCKDYDCPTVANDKKIYLDADSFIRMFAHEYIKKGCLGKKKIMSLWLYIHFTKTVRRWKNFKNKIRK